MTETPFVVDRFGGLNLYDDPQEVGASAAVAMLNGDLDQRGRLRSRDGSTGVTAASSNTQVSMGYYNGASAEFLVATEAGTLVPYNLTAGTTGATQSVLTNPSNTSYARFGDPSNQRLYVAAAGLFRWNGTAWTTVTTPLSSPATQVAVTANDNRLAVSDGIDTIFFSDAGAPETFGANNFVRLWPGDGEQIRAMVRWRDYLFVFKQTKFAVFTGTSIDSSGNPVFNYRAVDTARGVYGAGQATAGNEGVYFCDPTGIYLTSGDAPTYISRQVEPWLKAGTFGTLPTIAMTSVSLNYRERRLYVTYANGTSGVTLVLDPALGAWLVWQRGATCMASIPTSSTFRGLYFGDFSSKRIAKIDSTVATDLGSSFSWSYTSGAYDVSGNNRVAVTRESALWGTGTATMQVANDLGSFDTGSALTLGVSPAVLQSWQQIDREGTYWQHKLSGTGAATINRLTHYISFIKAAGIQ